MLTLKLILKKKKEKNKQSVIITYVRQGKAESPAEVAKDNL